MFTARVMVGKREAMVRYTGNDLTGDEDVVREAHRFALREEGLRLGAPAGPKVDSDYFELDHAVVEILFRLYGLDAVEIVEGELSECSDGDVVIEGDEPNG